MFFFFIILFRNNDEPLFRGWENHEIKITRRSLKWRLSTRVRFGGGETGLAKFNTERFEGDSRSPTPYPFIYHFGGKGTPETSNSFIVSFCLYMLNINKQIESQEDARTEHIRSHLIDMEQLSHTIEDLEHYRRL